LYHWLLQAIVVSALHDSNQIRGCETCAARVVRAQVRVKTKSILRYYTLSGNILAALCSRQQHALVPQFGEEPCILLRTGPRSSKLRLRARKRPASLCLLRLCEQGAGAGSLTVMRRSTSNTSSNSENTVANLLHRTFEARSLTAFPIPKSGGLSTFQPMNERMTHQTCFQTESV